MSKSQTFLEKCYKDREGHVVLWQRPNVPITMWFAATVLSKAFTHGKSHDFLVLVAFGSLFTWAWLEAFQGVNYARRALGIIVLVASLYAKLR